MAQENKVNLSREMPFVNTTLVKVKRSKVKGRKTWYMVFLVQEMKSTSSVIGKKIWGHKRNIDELEKTNPTTSPSAETQWALGGV